VVIAASRQQCGGHHQRGHGQRRLFAGMEHRIFLLKKTPGTMGWNGME
jgi:hypothetical protein